MTLGLRTTILINIVFLILLASGLISLVVLRVMEHEVYDLNRKAGEDVLFAIKAGIKRIAASCSAAGRGPAGDAALADFFDTFIQTGRCRQISLVDSKLNIIADAGTKKSPMPGNEQTVRTALANRLITARRIAGGDPRMIIADPVYYPPGNLAVIRAVFSVRPLQQRISRAFNIILLYIACDAAVLIAFGTFLLSRYVVTPVRRLIALTERLAEGRLDGLPLFMSKKNEIEKLSVGLTTMADKLRHERETIQQQLETLENKNRQLETAHREILQSEKLASIGRLASGIAHEIGNPAGILLGYIHMLRSGELDSGKRDDYLKRMQSEAERLNGVIRDLLDYAQPSSRDSGPVNINTAIQDCLSLVGCQKEFSSIKIALSLEEGLPPVYGNEKLIKQMLVNLLLNAKDAMPAGGRLSVSTSFETAAGGDAACIAIADTGDGIAPQDRKKIFDPFFTTKEQGKGTGLGLSNVHRIVELLGGTIHVDSTPGSGSLFMIRIPVSGNGQ